MKPRALQIRMIDPSKPAEPTEASDVPTLNPIMLNLFVKDQVRNAAIAIGAVILAVKAMDTASAVVIIKTTAKNQ